MMHREWVRGPQWPSDQARATWEPVLRRAQAAWSELEVASVSVLRDAALLHLTAEEVPRAASDCAAVGLELSVLAFNGASFRVAVHLPGAAPAWHRAWAARDDEAIGRFLGFPACCRAFFARTWGAGSCDPTPAMPTVEGPWEASILLRWLGVRLVPHLPCSGACSETARQARAYLETGRRIGLAMDSIEALLRLPATYSALNGVAIVETPHFRIMAGADQDTRAQLARAGQTEEPSRDNGFASRSAMEAAHEAVARLVGHVPEAIDLGAGDGALLARVADAGIAVEVDAARAAHGQRRHPQLVFRVETIRRFVESHPGGTPALLMPGRLLEVADEDAAAIRNWLRRCTRVVLYAYGDWLTQDDDGLAGLARRAGLRLLGPTVRAAGVEAAEGSAL